MYRRYYTRRAKRRGINKYNIENYQASLTFANAEANEGSQAVTIIPANNAAGVRKVTQLRGNFTTNYAGNMLVAVIYLPEGFDLSSVKLTRTPSGTTSNLYAPSQNVLWFGQLCPPQTTYFKVPISKNLNGGDQIVLAAIPYTTEAPLGTAIQCNATLSYAICYR